MTLVLFSYFAAVIVLAAIGVIASRKPVNSALALLVMFFHVAGLFVLLDAEFIAAVQIIVYAGAILVLYLFVVMLLNVRAEEGYHTQGVIGLAVGFGILGEAVMILGRSGFADRFPPSSAPSAVSAVGNTEGLGRVLYTTYLFPFEVASLILLVAMIGAIVLAKKGIFGKEGKRS
ncbi:MAG: NADH-quinone oxidoreductase subunit J [Nitrospirae bacterium]|nr:NADH-quinone oxidoreductase subunit J [Nitrospirota bacterium]